MWVEYIDERVWNAWQKSAYMLAYSFVRFINRETITFRLSARKPIIASYENNVIISYYAHTYTNTVQVLNYSEFVYLKTRFTYKR